MHLDGVGQALVSLQSHYIENGEKVFPTAKNFTAINNFINGDKASVDLEVQISKDRFETKSFARRGFISSELLSRIGAIQIACIAFDTAVTETLRGVICFVGGILTLRAEFIFSGLNDLISLVAQAIALPIMALVAIFHPISAMNIGMKLMQYSSNHPQTFKEFGYYDEFVFGSLFGLTSIPLSSVRSALRVPINLLDANLTNTFSAALCIVAEPLSSIVRLFAADSSHKYFQYSPMAYANLPSRLRWVFYFLSCECLDSSPKSSFELAAKN